jgi:molybdenum cofactor guanylyltransferase
MPKPLIIANILCGGRGSRIGGNKPLFIYEDKPLIEHIIDKLNDQCDEIILSLDCPQNPMIAQLKKYKCQFVFDNPKLQNFGPMAGVLAGLIYANRHAPSVEYIIAPCDMPNLPQDYVKRLLKAQNHGAIYYKGARDYPLCATISTSQIENLTQSLENSGGGLGAFRFLQSIKANTIEIKDEANFLNINTPIQRDKFHHFTHS